MRTGRVMRSTCLMLLLATTARGYTGGPVTVEVLGWDAKLERLYCSQDGQDESASERDLVYCFDFRSGNPTRPIVLDWSRASVRGLGRAADSVFAVRLATLRRGLRRLPIVDEQERSTLRFRVVPDTSPTSPSPRSDLKPVTLEGSVWTWRGVPEVRVVAYGSNDVRCLRRYAIPGRTGRIAVLSWIGDDDGPEEIQRAVVLLDDPAVKTQVLEDRRGVR